MIALYLVTWTDTDSGRCSLGILGTSARLLLGLEGGC